MKRSVLVASLPHGPWDPMPAESVDGMRDRCAGWIDGDTKAGALR